MVDDRERFFPAGEARQIAYWCNRRFGIGADGLILIRNDRQLDFGMVYFNANGYEGSMCGNGGCCAVKFAASLGLISERARFRAVDGVHHAELVPGGVSLGMSDVKGIVQIDTDYFMDTGSPHFVRFVDSLDHFDVVGEGRAIRNSPAYRQDGVNVNFVVEKDGFLEIRTYERGVEDETFSCGTGATAATLAWARKRGVAAGHIPLLFPGGEVRVHWRRDGDRYTDIQLVGQAEQSFKGEVSWENFVAKR